MVAEIGGYSGMLIGFSLLDLADFLNYVFAFVKFKKWVSNKVEIYSKYNNYWLCCSSQYQDRLFSHQWNEASCLAFAFPFIHSFTLILWCISSTTPWPTWCPGGDVLVVEGAAPLLAGQHEAALARPRGDHGAAPGVALQTLQTLVHWKVVTELWQRKCGVCMF